MLWSAVLPCYGVLFFHAMECCSSMLWSAVLPASTPIGAVVMNPKSCEMALVGMVKSVSGVTASYPGREGIIWEGCLEGCLRALEGVSNLWNTDLLVSSWLPQLGRQPWGLEGYLLFGLPLPEKRPCRLGCTPLRALMLSLILLACLPKSSPKRKTPLSRNYPSAKSCRSLFRYFSRAFR